jgi:hypothetical protein
MTYKVETSAGGFYGPYESQKAAEQRAAELSTRGGIMTVSAAGQPVARFSGGDKQPLAAASVQGGTNVQHRSR